MFQLQGPHRTLKPMKMTIAGPTESMNLLCCHEKAIFASGHKYFCSYYDISLYKSASSLSIFGALEMEIYKTGSVSFAIFASPQITTREPPKGTFIKSYMGEVYLNFLYKLQLW
jgi:hypothetical protein